MNPSVQSTKPSSQPQVKILQKSSVSSNSNKSGNLPNLILSSTKDTPISYNNRQDVKRNQISVHVFYVQKLYLYLKRKQRIKIDSEQSISRFNSAIRYFYNQAASNYDKSLRRRYSNSFLNFSSTTSNNITTNVIDNISFNDNQSHFSQSHESLFMPLTADYSYPELNDDTNLYRLPLQRVNGVKTQLNQIPKIPKLQTPKKVKQQVLSVSEVQSKKQYSSSLKKKEENQADLKSSEDDSESSDQLSDYAQRAEKQVNCLFFGNFAINNIKRKPKQQKIYLQLHNVFLKFSDNGRDTFFDRASFELKKSQKSDVPIESQAEQE